MSVLFLSHSSYDRAEADRLRTDLLRLGYQDVFLDNHSLLAGDQWEPRLYERLRSSAAVIVLVSAHSNASRWCFAEITHARALNRPVFPVVLDGSVVPAILSGTQAESLGDDREEFLDRLKRGLEALHVRPGDTLAPNPSRPPYPGLSAFDALDAGVYFGRESDVQRVLDRVHDLAVFQTQPRVLVVRGESGTGKSSLLRAGVLPRLALDARYLVCDVVRPAQRPLATLAESLASTVRKAGGSASAADLAGWLAAEAGGPMLERALTFPGRTVVVAVDQLEELAANRDTETQGLCAWLERLSRLAQARIVVLGTLRNDSVSTVQAVLPVLAQAQLLPLAALSEADLLRTITAPATAVGIAIEPELAQDLLADVRAQKALPLLAFTLRELWERRAVGAPLTRTAYTNELGRIDGAVRRAAEAATGPFTATPDAAEPLRLALLQMARVAPDGVVSRRPVLRALLPLPAQPAIDALVAARLLVVDGDTIEPSHESLFAAWKRLHDWVAEAQRALRVRGEAEIDAVRWLSANRGPEYLWPKARLERADGLLQAARLSVDTATASFLDASKAAVADSDAREQADRNREITRLRRQRFVVGAAGAVALLAAIGALGLYRSERQSSRASLLQSARIACAGIGAGARDVAIDALARAERISAGDDIRAAYVACLERPSIRPVGLHSNVALPEMTAPDPTVIHEAGGVRATLAPATDAGFFEVHTQAEGRPLAEWRIEAASANAVQVSANGSMVAVSSNAFGLSPQTVGLFDARSGRLLAPLTVESTSLGRMLNSPGRLAFDPAGRYLAVAGIAGQISAWDVSVVPPAQVISVRPFAAQATGVAFSPDGRWVAAIADDGTLAIIEVETSEVVVRTPFRAEFERPIALEYVMIDVKWTSDDRIRVGPLTWMWQPPLDRGRWMTATRAERQRQINRIAFDGVGSTVATAFEYAGLPHVLSLDGNTVTQVSFGVTEGFRDTLHGVALAQRGDEACAFTLSSLSCWRRGDGPASVIGAQDFRRRYFDVAVNADEVLAVGDATGMRFEVLDTGGRRRWERTLNATSWLGQTPFVFDRGGQHMTLRTGGREDVFQTIRLSDGEEVAAVRTIDPHALLQPAVIDARSVLISRADLSVRPLTNLGMFDGPIPLAQQRGLFSDVFAAGDVVVGRETSGGLVFRHSARGSECRAEEAPSPNNSAAALSASGRRFAALSRAMLTIWNTANCAVLRRMPAPHASKLAFSSDDRALAFQDGREAVVAWDDGSSNRMALDDCQVEWSSGWSDDVRVFWRACSERQGQAVLRGWNIADRSSRIDVALAGGYATTMAVALDPSARHVVVARDIMNERIWRWQRRSASGQETAVCPEVAIGRDQIRLLGNGSRAAWLERDAMLNGVRPATLAILDVKSCLMQRHPVGEAREILSSLPAGEVVLRTDTDVIAFGADGQRAWSALSESGRITHAAVSPDGSWVAAAVDGGGVVVARRGETEPRYRFRVGMADVTTVAVAANGVWVAAGSANGRLHLWPLGSVESALRNGIGSAAAP